MPTNTPDDYCLHHGFFSTLAKKGLLSAFITDTPATTTTDAVWLKKAEKYLREKFADNSL